MVTFIYINFVLFYENYYCFSKNSCSHNQLHKFFLQRYLVNQGPEDDYYFPRPLGLPDLNNQGGMPFLQNPSAQAALQAAQALVTQTETQGGPNTVLRVIVEHMIYPVTLDVLYQVKLYISLPKLLRQ